MTDPHAPTRMTATIKFPESSRYKSDNPWIVFEGTQPEAIKALIGEAFGIDTEGLTLSDVVINAQTQASAVGAAASGTGGQVIDGSKGGNNGAWGGVKKDGSKPADEAPKEPARDPIFDEIADCKTVEELQKLWGQKQELFVGEVMDAYKAHGKALSAAS